MLRRVIVEGCCFWSFYFSNQQSSPLCVPGTVLGIRDEAIIVRDKVLAFIELIVCWGRRGRQYRKNKVHDYKT